ncbi:MAG: type VI secretion system-associated FHA domain protein TagH, partial [Pseudomonadota bacterium]
PPGGTPPASPWGGDDPWAVDGPTPAPIDTSPKPGRSGGGDFDLAAISTPPASFGGGSGGGLSVPPGAPRPPAPPDPSGSPFGAAGLSRPPGGFTGAPSAAPPPLSGPPGGFGSGEGLSPPVPPAVPDPAPIPPAPPPPGFATQGVTPPPPMPDPAPSAPVPADSSAVVRAFCEGAGLRPDAYAHVDAEALARTLGVAMRLVVQETMVLLHDRAQAKLVTQAGEGTMTRAEGNNPLKFLPDAEQALVAMFLVGQPGFKGGPEAFADAFRDLRLHQKAVFEALQPALAKLMGDLSPEAIEEEAGGGLLGGSPWKTFVARWDAKSADHDNGILDEFFVHFAEAYGRATRRDQ